MEPTTSPAWVRWLENYLARSLAADAQVPETDVLPIVNSIRRSVLADEDAGLPPARPESFPYQPW